MGVGGTNFCSHLIRCLNMMANLEIESDGESCFLFSYFEIFERDLKETLMEIA